MRPLTVTVTYLASLLVPVALHLTGCESSDVVDEVDRAKRIKNLRKEASDQFALYRQSSEDPQGVDVDALKRYVELHGETTKVAPATCPDCYANHAAALSELGLYYMNLVKALRKEAEKAPAGTKAEVEAKVEKYRGEMRDAFVNSNRQFENYFRCCDANRQLPNAEYYQLMIRNCEHLEDFRRALFYLGQYEMSVTLSEEGKKNAELLRAAYTRDLERQEEEELRKELDTK